MLLVYEPETEVVGEEYEPDSALPEAIIVDLDGTLAHMDREPYDYSAVGTDRPDKSVIRVVQILSRELKIVVLTGRDEVCRQATLQWLEEHHVPCDLLLMRRRGDCRNDGTVKLELFDQNLRKHLNVVAVIDDRNSVVAMWRRLGLKCFQAELGDF